MATPENIQTELNGLVDGADYRFIATKRRHQRQQLLILVSTEPNGENLLVTVAESVPDIDNFQSGFATYKTWSWVGFIGFLGW